MGEGSPNLTNELANGRSRPLRVMHVSQPVEGGTAVVLEHLAAADLDEGRVVIIASPPGRLERWATANSTDWIELGLARNLSTSDIWAGLKIRRLLPFVDVVYLHSSKAGAIGRCALASMPRTKRPVCLFFPHAWSWYTGGRCAPFYRFFELIAAHWADVIVVVSRAEHRDGRIRLSRSGARRLRLMENGVDTNVYSNEGPVAYRDATRPLIVCVGRLCKQKGQDTLIRAMAALDDRTAILCLVGSGPAAASLRLLAIEVGVEDRVHFVGEAEPQPYYRAADIVAIPSRWEGLPLVLLEAMACGSAVVASREAVAEANIQSAVVTTDCADPQGLARTLTTLLTDAERRRTLGHRSRSAIEQHYSLHRATREYHSIVHSVLPDVAAIRPRLSECGRA